MTNNQLGANMTTERIDSALVQQFVGVSHGDLAQVKTLLAKEPNLVNACWDWGAGDWETGLGAASHTGQKAIAEFLLANGARMDLFCAVLLGKMPIIRAYLEDNSQVVHVKGPHGISLLKHAEIAGQTEVVELLKAHGA